MRDEPSEARSHLSEAFAAFPALERDSHTHQLVAAIHLHACLAEGDAARALEGDLLRLHDVTGFLHAGMGEAA